MKLTAFGDKEVRPFGKYAYFRKCYNDHVRDRKGNIVLYRPETSVETTNWCELIGVGPECEFLLPEHIGRFCLLPELVSG
ncbi:MAG: hypothetical protein FJY85_19955, partial [Deltaproteobacteria bacterium]|nr:hypothetical protein [Deltaproteobacteria bacterium]